jgi:hypothetical protein
VTGVTFAGWVLLAQLGEVSPSSSASAPETAEDSAATAPDADETAAEGENQTLPQVAFGAQTSCSMLAKLHPGVPHTKT